MKNNTAIKKKHEMNLQDQAQKERKEEERKKEQKKEQFNL